ncbi:LysM peptidoglycan-binding domain-containing protein [Roseobacter sp. S98]|uniref:LysM peptidoglycan-binding domain-containing protein n=1 Tax=Roseobacter algicola (ex Choi et al. 2025) (nom. illeg.) TaxID=3092138 RepID=UPI003F50F6E3
MSDKGGAAAKGGSGLLTAGIVIAVVIAAGTYLGLQDDAAPTQEDLAALVAPETSGTDTGEASSEETSPEPVAEAEPAEEAAPEEPEEAEVAGADDAPAPVIAPSVDEVRVDADGLMVIAGRAAPGETVRILIDGEEVATAVTDARGAFAAVASLSPSDAARVLTLETGSGDSVVASAADVILAPLPAPAPAVIAAAPESVDAPAEEVAPAEDTADTAGDVVAGVADAASGVAGDVAEQAEDAGDRVAAVVAEVEESVTDSAAQVTEDVTARVAEVQEEVADAARAVQEGVSDVVAGLQAEPEAPAEAAEVVETPAASETPAPAETAPAEKSVVAESQQDPAPQPVEDAAEVASVTKEEAAPQQAATIAQATDPQPAPETTADAESQTGVAQAEAPQPAAEATAEPVQQQIAVLQSTEEGVALLDTAPAAPRSVRLDTIGYSDTGVVQLAGRAGRDDVSVRVYLDNVARVTLPTAENGAWRGDVPDVVPGVYTLRLDALDAQGAVTSRLETPFKREAPEVLAEATDDEAGPVSAVTVQTGDTLWAIARERYGEGLLYVRVFEANRSSIRDPDLIYPGQIFDLPDDG